MDIGIRDASITDSGRTDVLACASELGVGSIELLVDQKLFCPSLNLSLADQAGQRELVEQLGRYELKVCALLLMTDFCAADAVAQSDWVVAAIDLARAVGAPAVRIDAHTPDRSLSPEFVGETLINAVRRIVTATASSTVDLGLENHAFISNEPSFLEKVFTAVSHERFGLTLDTGNFYWFGFPLEEIYAIIERMAGRVKHTHIKSIHYPPDQACQRRSVGLNYKECRCPLDEGDLDLGKIAKLLTRANYRRSLCIENESLNKFPPFERVNVLKRDVRCLRTLV